MIVKDLMRRCFSYLEIMLGKEPYIKKDIKAKTLRAGSDYGGWNILPNIADKNTLVYSFGIGTDISFDLDLIRLFGCRIHAFDPTPKSIDWLETQVLPENFSPHPFAVHTANGHAVFSPPSNPTHVSHRLSHQEPSTVQDSITFPIKNLKTIMRDLGHDQVNIIKMDIEGSEYEVIDDMLDSGIYPEHLFVEFHHRFTNVGKNKTLRALDRLRAAGYKVYSVSANNEEVSLCLSV